jgi:hypothetical protein
MDVLGLPFDMHVAFENTGDGCDCNCGEYRQYVRGYFRQNGKPVPHTLSGGKNLSRSDFQEDVILNVGHPYGHRYRARLWDSTTGRYYGTTYGSVGDAFTSDNKNKIDRENGCYYNGVDFPQIELGGPGEKVEIYLEFEGGPYDDCNKKRVGTWQSWKLVGKYKTPPSPPSPPTLPVPPTPLGLGDSSA